MSIAFRKKDYHYDGDEINENEASGDEVDVKDQVRRERAHKASAIPSQWTMSVFHQMKELADFHAVEIFDQMEPMILAEFVSSIEGVDGVFA